MFFFFFFFSSRRRHTRFDCDWSSDVCSSDLAVEFPSLMLFACLVAPTGGGATQLADSPTVLKSLPGELVERFERLRSEEHTSELQSQSNLVCRLLLEKKKTTKRSTYCRSYNI